MGQSTDAYLVYGIPVADEYEGSDNIEINGEEIEISTMLVRLAGHDPDKIGYLEQSAIEKASPLGMVRHCSDDYPMFILGIKETYQSASRGELAEIDPEIFRGDTDAWNQQLHKFADHFGLECEPKWYLVSYWG